MTCVARPQTERLHLTVPASWNVTTPLPTYQLALQYNDANQLTTTQTSTLHPTVSGLTTSQVYDSTTGVLTGLSNNLTAIANLASLSFNSNALVSDLTFFTSNGPSSTLADEHLSYDGDLRPVETTATWRGGSGSSGQLFDQSRWYDPASNVISLATTFGAVNSPNSEVQNFCYDEQSRLVWAGNSGSQPGAGNGTCGSQSLSHGLSGASYNNSFVYTHLGQLWQGPLDGSSTSSQYLYCTSAPHQLSGLYSSGATCANKSGQVYKSSTDAWGNVTSRTYQGTSTTLAYDALDHLVKWSGGSGNNEYYVYDASGTRVLRRATSGGTTTLTTYPFGIEDHTYSGDGTLQSTTYYYSLAGRLIGELTGSPTPTQTNLFLTDALGSVVDTFSNVAGSAAVLGSQVYGPYGTQRYQQGSMGTNKGFTGQYADATGLDYYNARYYDPVVGVFLSADTVQGNLQGMNPYGYVGGNPETRSDPTGHRQMCPPDGCGSGGSPNGHGTGRGPVESCYALDDCSGGGGVIPSPNNTQLQHDATHYVHGTKPTFLNSGLQGLLYLYLYDHHALVMQEAADWAVLEQLWQEAEAILVQQGIEWNASGAMELLHEKLIALTIPLLIMYTGGGFDHHVDLSGSIDGGGVDPSGSTSDGSGDTSGGFCSFTPQTLVATQGGEQPIGTLQVGEKVRAYNPSRHTRWNWSPFCMSGSIRIRTSLI